MSEAEAKHALQGFGLAIPLSQRAATVSVLSQAAQTVGFPLVLKGEGIAHKTEAGAVVVNIADQAALLAAAKAMPTERFLVEQMIKDVTVELLVGVVLDPKHGYVLTIAAGGTLTEILGDSANLMLPVSADDIKTALAGLRIAPLLDGYRGAAPLDKNAIIDAVMAVQSYVMEHTPIEIEINPLMCGPNGAIAADALITTGERHD